MPAECGISTRKWPEIQQKGQHNSPEDLTHQFPEKRGTGFPKCDQVNFPETGSEFREIGVYFWETDDDLFLEILVISGFEFHISADNMPYR